MFHLCTATLSQSTSITGNELKGDMKLTLPPGRRVVVMFFFFLCCNRIKHCSAQCLHSLITPNTSTVVMNHACHLVPSELNSSRRLLRRSRVKPSVLPRTLFPLSFCFFFHPLKRIITPIGPPPPPLLSILILAALRQFRRQSVPTDVSI